MHANLEQPTVVVGPLSPLAHDRVASSTDQRAARPVLYDALILDAQFRQALIAVRSLGRCGLRVAALETFGGVPTFVSRWCQERLCAPSFTHSTGPYLTYLEEVLERTPGSVLIPSHDGTVDLLRQHRARLEQRACLALAKEPALALAINKEQTLEIARRLGLGVPRGVTVQGVSDLPVALRDIGLPAVVKPVESWVRGAREGTRTVSHLVTTADEAYQAVAALTALGSSTLFQQYLTGRREAVSLLYAQGTVHARFAQWAKRTEPPLGGASVLRQSIAVPADIGEQAERLVRAIELEGYSEVEFRRDGAGKPYLMEINPRLSASVEVAVRAGVDFPSLLYQWARGAQIDAVQGYRAGIWMRYLAGDVRTTVCMLQQRGRPGIPTPPRALLDFWIAFCIPAMYDYWDWSDPLPAWSASAGMARRVLARGARGLWHILSPSEQQGQR